MAKSIADLIKAHNKLVSKGAEKWVNKHKPKKSLKASPNYSVTITKHHDKFDYYK